MSHLRLVYTSSQFDPPHEAAVCAKQSADDPDAHVTTLWAPELDADFDGLDGAEEDDAINETLVAIVVAIDQFLHRLCKQPHERGL